MAQSLHCPGTSEYEHRVKKGLQNAPLAAPVSTDTDLKGTVQHLGNAARWLYF